MVILNLFSKIIINIPVYLQTKPNTFEQDEQMNIKNPANKCQSNKIQFHPDDDFDSDDDVTFQYLIFKKKNVYDVIECI